MQFNSYQYYQYEVSIARLIQNIIDQAIKIENFKLTYIKHMKFDSYEVFLTIDEDKQKFISAADILKFLRKNNISVKQKEVDFLIDCYSSLKSFLFFKDFLKLILPQGDEDLLDTVVKQSLGVVKQTGTRISPLIEHKISQLLEMEIQMTRQIEQMKINICNQYFWSHKLSLEVLMQGKSGLVTADILFKFMQNNGDGRYKYDQFKYLKFRYSKNEISDSLLQNEFADMVYPYEFFYDKNEDIYMKYKSKEQEQEEEDLLDKKQQEKEAFDSKFKIIGDFIKDPEYYEKHENIVEFFENHKYRKLYKDLKDFDYYIQFAKEKIVFKKEEEEEKKEVLDFYQTIKQHQQDVISKVKKGHKFSKNNNNDESEENDLFNTKNMPKLKDYIRQLNYETPYNDPMTLKKLLKIIKADRNAFYYDRPEIKIKERMNLFKTIRDDMKKQELRSQVLDNKIESIKVEDLKTEEKERKKLFGAYSTYSMLEDVNTSSPKQNSPYKTYLYKQSTLKNISFGDILTTSNNRISSPEKEKLIKPQFTFISNNQDINNNNNLSLSQISQIQRQSSPQFQQKSSLVLFPKSQKNIQRLGSNQKIQSKNTLPQNNSQAKSVDRIKGKKINFEEYVQENTISDEEDNSDDVSQLDEEYIDRMQSQKSINFENIGKYTTPFKENNNNNNNSNNKFINNNISSNRSIYKIINNLNNIPTNQNVNQKPQNKQEKKKQDIIDDADRTIIEYRVLNCLKKEEMCKKITGKSNLFGNYKNKSVYKKFY